MRKKISTTVYLTEEQNQALKVLNKKTRIPIAEFIREGIDLILEKYKGTLPGQMSFDDELVDSGGSYMQARVKKGPVEDK